MNNYDDLSDTRLIELAQNGDNNAQDILLDKYKYLAKRTARTFFIMGADTEDVLQEGMLGLFKAIRSFDFSKTASFETYANVCISRQIINALKTASRMKHAPLNFYISTDAADLAENKAAFTKISPEELYINKEEGRRMVDAVYSRLSKFEAKVLALYLEGKNYYEIGSILEKDEKSITNAIQRIRKKTEQIISSGRVEI